MSDTETLKIDRVELSPGARLAGRYTIIEVLGKGGMGAVYRAHDAELKEEVALKLLRPELAESGERLERFRNELKLARRISHPNVGRMYELMDDAGTHFITMEYIPGEDLKSFIKRAAPLSIGKSVLIARQVGEGLSEAHRLGVVHRDLKPSNIMIDKEGNARIMDFGIARSLGKKGLTGEGLAVGTPEYMSPEQLEGDEVDGRSDIYSLGVVLYEMVTGRAPFEAKTPLGVALKHKTERPADPRKANPQVPEELSRLILRCLEKDKSRRYQEARELVSELTRIERSHPLTGGVALGEKPSLPSTIRSALRRGNRLIPVLAALALIAAALVVWRVFFPGRAADRPPGPPSIVVLPFDDLSPLGDQEVLCDGMTDEIISRLSRLRDWKVMNRTSAMRYKNSEKNIQDIGRELGVATILQGTLQKEGDEIRVKTSLIDADDGFNLWSQSYDRKFDRIFAIQSDIAENIVVALKHTLAPVEKARLLKSSTENLEAYKLYLEGRHFWGQRTGESYRKAIESFEKALKIDPGYALAYVGLADCYLTGTGKNLGLSPQEAYPKGKELVLKALSIDPDLAEARTSLASVLMDFDLDRAKSEDEFRRAIELNPGYATAHQWYSEFLAAAGRFEEALVHARTAIELDPLSPILNTALGLVHYMSGHYDRAIEQYLKTLEMEPEFQRGHYWLGLAYAQNADFETAVAHGQRAVDLTDRDSVSLAALAYELAKAGHHDRAKEVLNALLESGERQYVSPLDLAMIQVGLGNLSEAVTLLDRAYEERAHRITHIYVDPVFAPLRGEPRFQEILRLMNLPGSRGE